MSTEHERFRLHVISGFLFIVACLALLAAIAGYNIWQILH